MKKIAVAVDKDVVSGHFGLCENFLVFDLENGHIDKIEKVKNPGHRPCELPDFIETIGAQMMIAGSMGKAAAKKFDELNIKYIIGASGEARAAVSAFIEGSLKSEGELCDSWTCEFFDYSNCV
ncbi:MAG: NifB/NifX family molybdenum-iron cluster-binding protein [Sphaerochaetaceae bacterium]|jgi:predicted Fe-Mo cluster-binding NifX family protein